MERNGKNGGSDIYVSLRGLSIGCCSMFPFYMAPLSSCSQSPARDAPAWGALRRGHGSIWRERVSGEDGGGAPHCFGAQFEWLAEAKSPKCPYRPLVWQKTAGNSLAAGVCLWLPKMQWSIHPVEDAAVLHERRLLVFNMESHQIILHPHQVSSPSFGGIAKQFRLYRAGEGHPNILIYTQICRLNPDPNPTL